jgi:hypothetical protein
MHDFRALGVEDEATRALLYAIASIRRGGYTAAFSHVTHLSDLFAQGQVPQIDEGDPKFARALSLALTDRYTESQARKLGDEEHRDPKQHANARPTRPTTRTGTMATDAPQFTQAGPGGEPVPAYSPDNATAEAMEARREQAGLSTDRTIRDLNEQREFAAHTRTPPPEAGDAPAERGPGQLPDPNAEDGGLSGDEAAPPPVTEPEEGEEPEAAAPKKRGRRAKKAEAETSASA